MTEVRALSPPTSWDIQDWKDYEALGPESNHCDIAIDRDIDWDDQPKFGLRINKPCIMAVKTAGR